MGLKDSSVHYPAEQYSAACAWIDGAPCGAPALVRQNIPLCDKHWFMQLSVHSQQLRNSARFHELSSFPGLCYTVLLSGDIVKIGYSNSGTLFRSRLKALRSRYGHLEPLATFEGGLAVECLLHERFADARLPVYGELFRFTPEMKWFFSQRDPLSLL